MTSSAFTTGTDRIACNYSDWTVDCGVKKLHLNLPPRLYLAIQNCSLTVERAKKQNKAWTPIKEELSSLPRWHRRGSRRRRQYHSKNGIPDPTVPGEKPMVCCQQGQRTRMDRTALLAWKTNAFKVVLGRRNHWVDLKRPPSAFQDTENMLLSTWYDLALSDCLKSSMEVWPVVQRLSDILIPYWGVPNWVPAAPLTVQIPVNTPEKQQRMMVQLSLYPYIGDTDGVSGSWSQRAAARAGGHLGSEPVAGRHSVFLYSSSFSCSPSLSPSLFFSLSFHSVFQINKEYFR